MNPHSVQPPTLPGLMTLYELTDALDLRLEITRYPNHHGRFSASLPGVEIKGDRVLMSAVGQGTSPETAMDKLAKAISGSILVQGANSPGRKETLVPHIVFVRPA